MNPVTTFLVFVAILTGLAIGVWVSFYLVLPYFGVIVIIALILKVANVWPMRNQRRSRHYFFH